MVNARRIGRTTLAIIAAVVPMVAAVPGCGLLCRRNQAPSVGPFGDEAGVEALDSPDVRRLDSGLTAVTLRDEGSPVTSVQLWSPHGSADEPHGATGLAEICAERLCEGLPLPPGISLERWATFDATVCEFEAPRSLTPQLVSHVAALLDVRGARAGRASLVATCRDVEERWRRSRAEPHRLVSEILFQTAFGDGHPYGQPVLSPPPCDTLGEERLARACDELVDIQGMTVSSVSAAEPAELLAAMAGVAGDRPRGRARRPPPPSPDAGPRTSVVSVAAPDGHVAIGYRFEMLADVDRANVEVIQRILAERVRRRSARGVEANADEPGGFVFAGRDGGLLAIIVDAPPEEAIRSAWEVLTEAQALRSARPTEDEVGRARLEALRDHQQARLGASRLARAFGYDSVLASDPTYGSRVRKAISSATAAAIGEAASIHLAPERLAAAVVLPEPSKSEPMDLPTVGDREGRERLDVERLGAELARVVARVFAPQPGPRWEHLAGGIDRLRGTQGQTLLVRREQRSALVAVRAACPLETSSALSSAGAPEASWHDPSGVARGIKISVRGHVLAVEGLFLKHHVAAGMRAVIGTLFDQAPPRSDGRGRGVLESTVDAARDPLAAGRIAVERAFDPVGPGAKNLDVRERPVLRVGHLVVTVVGPVDPDEAYRALEASIPPSPEPIDDAAPRDLPDDLPQKCEVRQTVDLPRTHLWLAFPTAGMADRRRHALEVLAALLDAPDGQLRRRLVGAGLAFDMGADLWQDARRGFLALHAETSRANEEAVRRVLRQALDELRARPVPDAELDAARRVAASSLAREVATASGRAAALELAQRAGIAPAAALEAEARALEVPADDVARLARDLLDPARETVVVLGPEPAAP